MNSLAEFLLFVVVNIFTNINIKLTLWVHYCKNDKESHCKLLYYLELLGLATLL